MNGRSTAIVLAGPSNQIDIQYQTMPLNENTSASFSICQLYKLNEDSNSSLSVFSLFNYEFSNELKVHVKDKLKSSSAPVIYQEISNNQLRNLQIHTKPNFSCKDYDI
ncbi:hypothetical protein RhiirC2_796767 [Rhizophagus irregularis]|uniref:Uncharacterized protein n=1 Tax=Rhizophagus irregularis TaxID=588596 RepID=A0A2N1M961_9GLOM|nr:hypothetical protein RhiirC2_796767 [Rhizophagus irregularis]